MYLIDTNIILYHLDGMPQATACLQRYRGQMCVSLITVIEVLSYPYQDDEREKIERFLRNNFVWIDLSHDIVFKTAQIRGIKKTKTPDAIIGATALQYGYTLVSRNQKDFRHLPLTLINPMD